MSQGDFSIKCQFRKSDYLLDLQDSFNEAMGSLNSLLKEIFQTNMKNSLALSEIVSELRKDDFVKDQVIQKINAIQERIKKSDASFKLAP
jgi:DNA primase large subunit